MEHWDPQPSERKWFRNRQTGDLGWLVRREGKDRIRLDRPMQEIVMPFVESSWDEERDFRPFSRNQVTRLAFEADKLLCAMLGLHKEAKREWLSLPEPERIEWMKSGPGPGKLRAELYLSIRAIFDKHSR